MILNIFAYYNEDLEAFGNFQLDDHSVEQVRAGLSRDLRAQFKQGKADNLKNLKVYCLGTFNDETGEFKNSKVEVLDLGAVISKFEEDVKAKETSV